MARIAIAGGASGALKTAGVARETRAPTQILARGTEDTRSPNELTGGGTGRTLAGRRPGAVETRGVALRTGSFIHFIFVCSTAHARPELDAFSGRTSSAVGSGASRALRAGPVTRETGPSAVVLVGKALVTS